MNVEKLQCLFLASFSSPLHSFSLIYLSFPSFLSLHSLSLSLILIRSFFLTYLNLLSLSSLSLLLSWISFLFLFISFSPLHYSRLSLSSHSHLSSTELLLFQSSLSSLNLSLHESLSLQCFSIFLCLSFFPYVS
jgi:hypothetical protein